MCRVYKAFIDCIYCVSLLSKDVSHTEETPLKPTKSEETTEGGEEAGKPVKGIYRSSALRT